jgi:hypothetical protein
MTYPQKDKVDWEEFKIYFLKSEVFAVINEENKVLGGFYIKPNFQGRSSHICK